MIVRSVAVGVITGFGAVGLVVGISDVMAQAEKALMIATARERVKIISARLEVVNKELAIAMVEMVALQAQLSGTTDLITDLKRREEP